VNLTQAQRAAIKNGIWLCQTCSKLIDSDEQRYTMDLLRQWKTLAEQEAHRRIGKTKSIKQPSNAERELIRDLKLRDQMRKEFLKTWNELQRERPYKGGPAVDHPYQKFRYSKVVIHRIGDDVYPEVDDRPGTGISSWFRVEPYDFYHAGIKVILGIESGVIEHGWSWNGKWAISRNEADFDKERFKKIDIWNLGLIPFRNIRHYDLHGDEFYNDPHLYCTFNIDGMPYERFEHAVVGRDEYDWPLKAELQLPEEAVR
jgi:hypothetical protein